MLTFGFSEIKKKGLTMRDCGKIRSFNVTMSLLFCALGTGIISCSSSVKVDGFDQAEWKADTSACQNKRIELVDKLVNNKQALISYKDEKIMDYLGKPDNTIFFARGKKTLIYYFTPSKNCASKLPSDTSKSIRIDIDALGRAELVYILNQ